MADSNLEHRLSGIRTTLSNARYSMSKASSIDPVRAQKAMSHYTQADSHAQQANAHDATGNADSASSERRAAHSHIDTAIQHLGGM